MTEQGVATALITGASSGIGEATALLFARSGYRVIGVARRADRLSAVIDACREHSPGSEGIAGDLADRDFAESAVASALAGGRGLDVLVNNAAVTKHKHVFHLEPAECEYTLRANFLSCLWMTLAVLPSMRERGTGTLVNVSSFAGEVTPAREAVYAASKAAMNAFSQGLWHDLDRTGIHVGIVTPGPIDTEIWSKTDEPTAYRGPKYPPEQVADAILEVVRKRRYEVTIPRRNLSLNAARWLRLLAPSLLRLGMRRMDPNPYAVTQSRS